MSEDFCRCGRGHEWGLSRRKSFSALLGAGLASALFSAPQHASAGATMKPPLPEDEGFMRIAIAEAAKGDFPFGAAIVSEGQVIATGRNLGKTNDDPTAHAEMVAMRSLIAERRESVLKKGATLYASGEPCPMCMGAILWCGIGRIVFAASIEQLSQKIGQIMVTSEQLAKAAPFANIAITGGVLAAESIALFG
ncbi:nucleoside deaminase [Methylocella tundrae]|uniref:tRNA(Arg) A34 adenosine deaminase TadA n=1 Tax=Methylocella tundrae TaxID=227605 RepID=A0A4U8Z620_METTU|nr:nucleoside deaminase [Methylocella tundrae]WPP04365.1 nucleoside deaminase [Methylocella tundrae]VFU10713.1 tRNA(Arg) A34 adenosine deaminase TadA [Methylocella tundrae]